jgi:hypothetical protein
MSGERDDTTSSDLGGAPGGLGGATGADPRGPAAGERNETPERDRETRSFAGSPPGRTPPGGEGGGAMSGRGQESGPDDMAVQEAEPTTSAPADETSGAGGGATGGTGAAAGGDAHLGRDGERLGDPANAARQVNTSDSGDLEGGG